MNSFANAATSYNVTVYKSGSTIYAKSSSGQTISSGTSASSVISNALRTLTSGGTAYIQAGVYSLASPISVSGLNNLSIIGDSATVLQASNSMGYMFIVAGSSSKHSYGLKIMNIIFDGNNVAAGLSLKWIDKITIDDVEVKNTMKTKYINGIDFLGTSGSVVSGIVVTNSRISNIYGSGLAFAYATDVTVNSNSFVDCAQYYPSGGAIHADDGCQRFTIRNNVISGRSDNDGIYIGTSRSFASGVVISGNTINLRLYGSGGGAAYAGAGIKVYTLGAEISGNTINWNGTPYVYGISDWGQSNNIHDNTISYAAVGIGDQTGYYSTGSRKIINNYVTGSKVGIKLVQSGSTVTGNTLTRCTTPISNQASKNTVSGNIIIK